MARNVSEYNALINLRQAIVGKAEAQRRANETQAQANNVQKGIDSRKFHMDRPENYAVHDNVRRMERHYAYQKSAPARIRGGIWYGTKLGFFIILALVALVGGGILTYRTAIWSWNTSVGSMTGMSYIGDTIEYNIAVGLHLFGTSLLTLGLCGLGLFLGIKLTEDCNAIAGIPLIIYGSILGLGGIIAFFAACSYYYEGIDGFWMNLLTYIGSFLGAPLVIKSMFLVLIPILICAAAIAGVIGSIFVCTLFEYDYNPPSINYSELYKTKEYLKAKRKDEEETRANRKEYTQEYNEEKERFDKQISAEKNKKSALDKAVSQYRGIIQKCDYLIQHTTCLHPSYKNLKSLNIILYYIEYNRADTIKEAINEYVHDKQALAFLDKLDSIDTKLSQLTAIQAKQLQEIRSGIMTMENRMNQMQNAITASINSVGASLNSTLNMINKDNNRYAQMQLETDQAISQKLSWIGDHTYHLLHR